MAYSERELSDAMKIVRNKFFRSVGMAGVIGAAGLYFLMDGKGGDITPTAMLFCGFIVGFFLAGLVIPFGFQAQLKKGRK